MVRTELETEAGAHLEGITVEPDQGPKGLMHAEQDASTEDRMSMVVDADGGVTAMDDDPPSLIEKAESEEDGMKKCRTLFDRTAAGLAVETIQNMIDAASARCVSAFESETKRDSLRDSKDDTIDVDEDGVASEANNLCSKAVHDMKRYFQQSSVLVSTKIEDLDKETLAKAETIFCKDLNERRSDNANASFSALETFLSQEMTQSGCRSGQVKDDFCKSDTRWLCVHPSNKGNRQKQVDYILKQRCKCGGNVDCRAMPSLKLSCKECGGCFPPTALATVVDSTGETSVQLKDLRYGDRMKSAGMTSANFHIGDFHMQEALGIPVKFVQITHHAAEVCPDVDFTLRLTPGHMLFRLTPGTSSLYEPVRAADIRVGDMLHFDREFGAKFCPHGNNYTTNMNITQNEFTNAEKDQVVASVVRDISSVFGRGFVSPISVTGSFFVDGVYVSAFSVDDVDNGVIRYEDIPRVCRAYAQEILFVAHWVITAVCGWGESECFFAMEQHAMRLTYHLGSLFEDFASFIGGSVFLALALSVTVISIYSMLGLQQRVVKFRPRPSKQESKMV